MAERGQRLQPTTLPPRQLQKHRNCGRWHLETLPAKSFMKPKRPRFLGSVNSRRWVFVREGLDDFRKGCPRHQHPKDVFLPHVQHRLPQATPKQRQNGLSKGAALLSKLPQGRKAFLEDVEDSTALHPLALYPHLEEALPPELLLQVLEVLDPEKNLEESWAYCRDTRKLIKGPTELEEKCSSQVCLPKKMPVSHSDQWLCEEKPSEVNSLYQDSLLHDNVRRGVRDFCDWAEALNPHKPKRVKMRYGAWYLKTNLWKKQRADEPLVDPKILHKAQDANFEKHLREQAELLAGLHGTVAFQDFIRSRGYRMPRFLEKIYADEKGRSENIKTPKKLTPTARHPGRR
ncbi:Protein FAM47E [Lemmus lemmus]